MSKQPQKKKPWLLYLIIITLAAAVIGLGILTFLSMENLTVLQAEVTNLQKTVQEISNSSAVLIKKAKELEALEEQEEAAEQAGTPEPAPAPEETISDGVTAEGTGGAEPAPEEGTISPSQGSIFSANTDEDMDNLISQLQTLLPQNNGIWSVYVCNLSNGTEGVIGGQSMQAASLIKLFIMGAVYENYEQLSASYGSQTLDSLLYSMITVSDNDAANTLVGYLGGGDSSLGMAAVNSYCQAHGYNGTSMGRLLLQSNEYGDNYTTVSDCGKFLREIYEINSGTAQNTSLAHADAMYELLKQQQRTHKIPALLPEGVHTANKTGELSNAENDAGIIYDTAKGIDLVVCFMSENLSEVGSAQSSIAQLSRQIYGYYNE